MNHTRVAFIFVILLVLPVTAIVLLLDITFDPAPDRLDTVISTVAAIAAVLGVVGLLIQFSRDADLSEASFVTSLNNDFMQNAEINKVYRVLEEWKAEYDTRVRAQNIKPADLDSRRELAPDDPFKADDTIELANYLSFFEPLANLVERKMVRIAAIDIMAYRFFIAVNNKHVQTRLLSVKTKEDAWTSIRYLYREWKKHRQKEGRTIYLTDFDLLTEKKGEESIR